jgi:hypothetical protein
LPLRGESRAAGRVAQLSKVKLHAKLELNEEFLAKVKEKLLGAAKLVHNHRLSVGLHEAEASAAAVKIASGQHNTDKAKNDYRGKEAAIALIDVAMIHEFGIGVPDRSWLRTWFDQNVERLKVECTEAMRAEYSGDEHAVQELAKKLGEELKAWISTGAAGLEPLSEATKRERVAAGLPADPPLFATGQLVRSLRAMFDAEYVD